MEAVIQECKLSYRFAPVEGAPVLLLLHGWGCDGAIFHAFEAAFSKHASLLTVDFPGHGQSGEPPVPWGVADYARQIIGLLDLLEIETADVIAHSFGGRVALWMASQHPKRIGKMVITGGAGIRKPASGEQSKKQKQYQFWKTQVQRVGKVPFLKPASDKLMESLRQKYGSADYKKLGENMRKTFVKVISEDLSPLLPEVKASTLLVWGSADTETPLWMGQQMEKTIPDAGLVVFDGRSHFAFLEEAARFEVIVHTFLWGGSAA